MVCLLPMNLWGGYPLLIVLRWFCVSRFSIKTSWAWAPRNGIFVGLNRGCAWSKGKIWEQRLNFSSRHLVTWFWAVLSFTQGVLINHRWTSGGGRGSPAAWSCQVNEEPKHMACGHDQRSGTSVWFVHFFALSASLILPFDHAQPLFKPTKRPFLGAHAVACSVFLLWFSRRFVRRCFSARELPSWGQRLDRDGHLPGGRSWSNRWVWGEHRGVLFGSLKHRGRWPWFGWGLYMPHLPGPSNFSFSKQPWVETSQRSDGSVQIGLDLDLKPWG